MHGSVWENAYSASVTAIVPKIITANVGNVWSMFMFTMDSWMSVCAVLRSDIRMWMNGVGFVTSCVIVHVI